MQTATETQLVQPIQSRLLDKILPEHLKPEMVRALPLEFLKKQCAIPILLEDGQVAVAVADALNVEAYDTIVNALGRPCERVICPAAEIEHAISRCYYQGAPTATEETHAHDTNSETTGASAQTHAEDLLSIATKAPVVKLVNKILFQAAHSRASDIHIEPYENETRIRFRIDGALRDIAAVPRQHNAALVSRLKIMANLNIAERRLPQDGQSRIKIGQNLMDIRVSVIPTLCGERVMLRLLDKSSRKLTLNEVGFSPNDLKRFRQLALLPHGIILLTGPTGSGKTTTLYAALNELNSEQRNILTVEDPIEYQIPGVGQMQVKPKINLTFANCLRHILRQDPNVIMIGEIRDTETAEITIQASLTGHLVLSTLHTNDSASAMTRLVDMGIEPYLISSAVVAVVAQRLVRLICPECKQAAGNIDQNAGLANENDNRLLAGAQLFKGAGCEHCLKTGYFGRTGIFELLVVDDEIRDLVTARNSTHIIKQTAVKKGLTTLRQDGLCKVAAGLTTLEEVCRVTTETMQME
ncbi:MAG: type II secretion system ATPase GspE [Planctomycetota bacterium]